MLAGQHGAGATDSTLRRAVADAWRSPPSPPAPSLLVAFVLLEARLGARAMMPLHLFGTRSFVGVTLLTLFLYAALGGLFVLLPFLLIEVGGYSTTAAGAALLPLPVAMGLGSRAAGRLAERTGARLLLTVGPCIAAVGFALFLRVGVGRLDYASVMLPALAVVAIGLTLSVAPLTAAVMGAVDAAHVGSASGVNNAVARVAGLLATALLGFVLAGDAKGEAFVAGFHAAAIAACRAGGARRPLGVGAGQGRRRRRRPAADTASGEDAKGRHRPVKALEHELARGLHARCPRRAGAHALRDQDLAAGGLAAQARGQVGHGADGAVVDAPFEADARRWSQTHRDAHAHASRSRGAASLARAAPPRPACAAPCARHAAPRRASAPGR